MITFDLTWVRRPKRQIQSEHPFSDGGGLSCHYCYCYYDYYYYCYY